VTATTTGRWGNIEVFILRGKLATENKNRPLVWVGKRLG